MSDIELPDLPPLKTEHWRAVLAEDQRPHQLHTRLHVVGFRSYEACEGFVASELDMKGWRYTIEELVLRSDAEAAILADREKRAQEAQGVEYQVLGFVSRYGKEIRGEYATGDQPVYVRAAIREASKPVQAEAPSTAIHQHGFAADNNRLRTINESLDKQLEEVMAERDERDDVLGRIAGLIDAEFTSAYGFADLERDLEERLHFATKQAEAPTACPHGTPHRWPCDQCEAPTASNEREAQPQAEPTEWPTVPDRVMELVQVYGDARADDKHSALRLSELIYALRQWAGTLKAAQAEPRDAETKAIHLAQYHCGAPRTAALRSSIDESAVTCKRCLAAIRAAQQATGERT